MLPSDRSANLANVAPSSNDAAPRVLVQWGEPREVLDVKW